ncbi:MAG: aspartate/glutamate racemase family protein, partial [Bacteroidales bacterium]
VELFAQIVRRTRAPHERDHLRILIDNNPKVPGRMPAIFGTGESCLPELLRSARALRRAGAEFLVIPCVTVHYFHGALQKRTPIPILNIIDETVARVVRRHRGAKRVGVMATTGAIHARLFDRAMSEARMELLVPTEKMQLYMMKAVAEIKRNGATKNAAAMARKVARTLLDAGADVVIAGCTELPLVLRDGDLPVPIVDPIAVLAEAAIAFAGGRVRARR